MYTTAQQTKVHIIHFPIRKPLLSDTELFTAAHSVQPKNNFNIMGVFSTPISKSLPGFQQPFTTTIFWKDSVAVHFASSCSIGSSDGSRECGGD